jgi:hypothetical protein
MSVVCVMCCQVEVSAFVQRGPIECGVSDCDREASIVTRYWPTRGCCVTGGGGGLSYVR